MPTVQPPAMRRQAVEIHPKFRDAIEKSDTSFGRWCRTMGIFRSSKEVAAAIGLSRRSVYDFLSGRTRPSDGVRLLMTIYSTMDRDQIVSITNNLWPVDGPPRLRNGLQERYINHGDNYSRSYRRGESV